MGLPALPALPALAVPPNILLFANQPQQGKIVNNLAWAVASQAGNNGHGKCGLPIVGFCFSFALEQEALNSGKLMVWTKGFDVDGVIGKDVVQLLSGVAFV